MAQKLALTVRNLNDTEKALQIAEDDTAEERAARQQAEASLEAAHQRIADSSAMNTELQDVIHSKGEDAHHQYQLLRTARRHNQRLKINRTSQRQMLHQLKKILLPAAEERAHRAEEQLQAEASRSQNELLGTLDQIQASKANVLQARDGQEKIQALLDHCRREVKVLRRNVARAKNAGANNLVKAQDRMKKQSHTYRMKCKGQYTTGVRMLARAFTKSGCSQRLVGPMIRLAGSVMGIKVTGKLTARTVGRTIREGGVAARIQLGSELSKTKSKSNISVHSGWSNY